MSQRHQAKSQPFLLSRMSLLLLSAAWWSATCSRTYCLPVCNPVANSFGLSVQSAVVQCPRLLFMCFTSSKRVPWPLCSSWWGWHAFDQLFCAGATVLASSSNSRRASYHRNLFVLLWLTTAEMEWSAERGGTHRGWLEIPAAQQYLNGVDESAQLTADCPAPAGLRPTDGCATTYTPPAAADATATASINNQ